MFNQTCACTECRENGPYAWSREVPDEIYCYRCGDRILDDEPFEVDEDEYSTRLCYSHTRKDCDCYE